MNERDTHTTKQEKRETVFEICRANAGRREVFLVKFLKLGVQIKQLMFQTGTVLKHPKMHDKLLNLFFCAACPTGTCVFPCEIPPDDQFFLSTQLNGIFMSTVIFFGRSDDQNGKSCFLMAFFLSFLGGKTFLFF